MKNEKYFVGLDIGTDSVGYAVTDLEYNLIKCKGEPMWGVSLFDEAKLSQERRSFRSARRRLDRKQQRIKLLQEIFAKEISKVDTTFFARIKESMLIKDDRSGLFTGLGLNDKEYYKKYPTIHHLIVDLMDSKEEHDIRLVYLACSWLLNHRGHFLYDNISSDNIDKMLDFSTLYDELLNTLKDMTGENFVCPWNNIGLDIELLGKELKSDKTMSDKMRNVAGLLYGDKKMPKKIDNPDNFPFSVELIFKLLCGGEVSLKELFGKEEYAEAEKFSLDKNDEEYEGVLSLLGDDSDLIVILKKIYDWEILSKILKDGNSVISKEKVKIYNQHKEDLKFLKYFVKKYCKNKYNEIFRVAKKKGTNYTSYSGNFKNVSKDNKGDFDKCGKIDFCKYVKGIVQNIEVDQIDNDRYNDMLNRLSINKFMPKQIDSDNRVIPYQLYNYELKKILERTSTYLPFLNEKDSSGFTNSEKILSIMQFRVPYYVGPLNKNNSTIAWIERKAEGKIYPWNFEEMVDLDKSEQAFIDRMTNTCTYYPGEDVLPKHSLLYEKFEVLNIINNIRVMDKRISVEAKQKMFESLFMNVKKVTKKRIIDFLMANNYYTKADLETLQGIDDTITSNLNSHISFKKMIQNNVLKEADVERIVERMAYSENKTRFKVWLKQEFPNISEDDKKYISTLNIKGFGRLSKMFLNNLLGVCKKSGEANTIIGFMWDNNINLMELLSDNYTFVEELNEIKKEYYTENPKTLSKRLDDLHISNASKRPIIRTLEILKDIEHAMGNKPLRIFVEMARDKNDKNNKKRTISRKENLLELYKNIKDNDAIELRETIEQMGDNADNKLQSDKLYLYYTQLGKCMYTGTPIDLNKINDGTYNIEHVYPQSKVKDDSIHNNEVLVLSEVNGQKSDAYPINGEIRSKMHSYWKYLVDNKLITEEKYKRLTRNTPFTDEEKLNFINRQIVETRQSTKAVAEILREKYSETEIVYVKAGLVSDFRQAYNLLKSRLVNDLHHAKDAYLNIVCGNVYHEKFTKEWFYANKDNYSINSKKLFTQKTIKNGQIVWDGQESLDKVIKTMKTNSVHMCVYQYQRTGGLFDQMLVKAKDNLIERKKGLETEKYGGYNKPTISFFYLIKYYYKNQSEIIFLPIELLYADIIKDVDSLKKYAQYKLKKTEIEKVELPLGLRKIKINTIVSLDGFKYYISGVSGGATVLILKPFMPLKISFKDEIYIKKIEMYLKKKETNKNIKLNEEFDGINRESNINMYNIFKEKMNTSIFSNRINNPSDIFNGGFNKFCELELDGQVQVLKKMLDCFSRVAGGCNLEELSLEKGKLKHAAAVTANISISNWYKKYKEAKILDLSAAGINYKTTINLFELL